MVRSSDDFPGPTPSDPLRETERFRDMREALREAAAPADQGPTTRQRKEPAWRRALRAVGLGARR